jgi:hypothetical protein
MPAATSSSPATIPPRVVINGLVILSDRPVPWNAEHTNRPEALRILSATTVCGPGAFVLVVQNFNSFGRAIIKKLIAEIAFLPAGGARRVRSCAETGCRTRPPRDGAQPDR